MTRYKTVKRSLASLASEFFHDPEDFATSINDFLEDQFTEGWGLVSMDTWLLDANTHLFVFRANGQP